jgi:hypothetical protein
MGDLNTSDDNTCDEWPEIKPLKLIECTKDYIVYIDRGEDVNWQTTQEYDDEQPRCPSHNLQRHNSILNGQALLEATPDGHFDKATKLNFKRLLGEAIACSLDHDYEGAQEMLTLAGQFIRARSEETSRFWYLSASFLMAAVFLVAGITIWIYRERASNFLSPTGTLLALASAAGAMGALLSVILRSGSLKFDASAGRYLHYLEAASRIWAGALSGFLVALAVKYNLILTAFSRDGNPTGIMMLAGFAAGASERLASSIISKFETTEEKTSSDKEARKSAHAR